MSKNSAIILEPAFGYASADGKPHQPTFQEVIKELVAVMKVMRFPTHFVTASNFVFQVLTGVVFLIFLDRYILIGTVSFIVCATFFIGTIYNTIWYHRYCAHVAFEFSNQFYAMLLLWTNPLTFIFREEIYIFPHRIHHEQTEKSGDPYGPHCGWLASLLAPELTQRFNPTIVQEHYDSLVRSIQHIGFPAHSHEWFRKTACFENFAHYWSRIVVSQFLWIGTIGLLGGLGYIAAYYSAIFISTILIRDFNWRGHGGNFRRVKRAGWEFGTDSYALNQYFYGYIASEWHDNHHKYPFSANNGFLPGQIDIAFLLIKWMYRVGIVRSYVDAKASFEKECLGLLGVDRATIVAR
jgi:stearoyl-CoA desaturase (delta-9 desaturase)